MAGIKKQSNEDNMLTCLHCGKTLKRNSQNFFKSNKYEYIKINGYVNICKKCIREMCYSSDGLVSIDGVKMVLQYLDKPFIWDLFNKVNADKFDIGTYTKQISLSQYKNLTFNDSDKEEKQINNINEDLEKNLDSNNIETDFKVTQEILKRWGSKHNKEDYIKLEDFYHKMKNANNIETPQDESYLKKLAVISVKMDDELEVGHYDEAKKLGDLYSKYMADSKFRAMDKTDADKTGGIRTFCQIYAETEKDDFIPPWEYYRKIKGIKQDIVDKTIMHIENFTLRLNKIERMIKPPLDTPKLEDDELDEEV